MRVWTGGRPAVNLAAMTAAAPLPPAHTTGTANATGTLQADVAIAGAGMVGATLAVALGNAGLRVVLIDRATPAALTASGHDGRTSAIAHGSKTALEQLGLWTALAPHACAIEAIRVSDGPSLLHLHFDPRELAAEGEAEPLGYIVENRHTRLALFERLETHPAITLRLGTGVAGLERDERGATLALEDGSRVRAALAVAAEGRNSALRARAGIGVVSWPYPQIAIVCTAIHERPHGGVAQERFLPAGPFAILPMTDDAEGRHRSSIVWTERAGLAPRLLGLDEDAFAAELAERFGDYLGAVRPAPGRWSHPLGLLLADRYADRRLVLAGDAAHAIHPIAGQGLNLGLRDVAALAEVLVDAARLGLDIGSQTVLAGYERWRRFDNMALALVTDGLNRLFSNDLPPVRLARDLGLAAVNRLPGAKGIFMRHAMGTLGTLPRLIRGEAL